MNIRPKTIEEIIGLDDVKQIIKYDIGGAVKRGSKIPHILLSSPPGLGKTTVAYIVSQIMGGVVHRVLGTDLTSADSVIELASLCKDNDAIFIEEAHGIGKKASYALLPWMEEFILVNSGNIPAPKVAFIFATTNAGMLSDAIRNRCRSVHINYYSVEDLKKIIRQAASMINYDIQDDEALTILAKSSRGTPRVAIEQRLDRVMNVMAIDNLDFNKETVLKTLNIAHIHPLGLDKADIVYCETLYKLYCSNGYRPVSYGLMCSTTGFSPDVISNVIESYLNQSGIISITPRGRILTELGYSAIGKNILEEPQKSTANTIEYENEGKYMSDTPTRNRKNEIPQNAEFASNVENLIKLGNFSVKAFADENNFNPLKLKESLASMFGSNIVFKRGRSGGVFWNESK